MYRGKILLFISFCHKGITLGICLGSTLLIDVSKAHPQNKPFLQDTASDVSQRFQENVREIQQYGRKYADKQYLRPLANDEIANKFLSFDVPDTIEAYQPELNKIADVPIYLGERSRLHGNVYLNFYLIT